MATDQWTKVDQYLAGLFVPSDPILEEALQSAKAAGMPAINVSQIRESFSTYWRVRFGRPAF